MTGLRTSGQLLLVVIVSALVAFLVTRLIEDPETRESIDDAAPVALADRATASLETVTIQPVLSGDGRVAPGASPNTWLIEAPIAPADQAYRLVEPPVGVKARILGGPSGFDCAWGGLGVGPDGNTTMRCEVPRDITVVAGLRATMVVQMEPPKQAPGLPLTAVRGTAEQGQVVVVHDGGSAEIRDVTLGVSDGINIEITGGLQPGERVLLAPIELDFREAA